MPFIDPLLPSESSSSSLATAGVKLVLRRGALCKILSRPNDASDLFNPLLEGLQPSSNEISLRMRRACQSLQPYMAEMTKPMVSPIRTPWNNASSFSLSALSRGAVLLLAPVVVEVVGDVGVEDSPSSNDVGKGVAGTVSIVAGADSELELATGAEAGMIGSAGVS